MNLQWDRIERRLRALGCLEQMELRPGASAESLDRLERHLGLELPVSLRSFLSIHDGQDGFALLLGYQFLSTDGIRKHWDTWRSIDEPAMNEDCAEFMQAEPEGFAKPVYTNRLWIPLTWDYGGNHMGLDFDPDRLGRAGQVITFGRDEDTKHLLADDFDGFVERCIAWLEGATWDGQHLEHA
jgi:cell wall assembly regulator SMI1